MDKANAIRIFAGLLGLFLLAGCSEGGPVSYAGGNAIGGNPELPETIATGSTGAGDVLVELAPRGVTNGRLEVDIVVNTHSVSLEQFDLREITMLEFSGKSLKPVSAPALSGHHSSGTLVFEVSEPVSSFRISIKGIPKVDERVFEWG